ncbi:4Fe-4S binding protein [Thermosediminibacter oceani]|uniref:BFD domain protein (2Fe-2S)-binding domain protein n=1 Tax=Thermosediminibacter oceani (strain ATCC BAA-1034 / DSM 16646 / JW/IW-1228P) TaxID=555079 RepID=D9S0Z6_THEOJ|nr:4Fe-4S binding protein [Thermosediminibacter oceani]ADL07160.1 BFD domain protein (2Fe-2S)-binding domain protein [Thermosediminibacter oceani DSM 16646]
MKLVNLLAVVDEEKCRGCKTCEKVCPVLAIKMVDRKAKVDEEKCRGCAACEQRCPFYAISMAKREQPVAVGVDVSGVDYSRVEELCRRAKLHPEQIVCYCTATRAEEVAAAVLQGARSPEDVSLVTGARTGCKVECIQPILRLLETAGIKPEPPKGGWQWYGRTPTVWEVPNEVKKKYASRGFYFDEDIKLLDGVAAAPLQGEE